MAAFRKPNWWGRNWKWFVPAGCLTAILLAIGFVVIILTIVFGAMKRSGPYQDGLATAKNHPEVQEALGTPIDAGLFMGGSIHVNGASGNADITFPISGPRGKARVYIVGRKRAGNWQYSHRSVELENGTKISL